VSGARRAQRGEAPTPRPDRAARVKVVGLGGVGSIAARYLAVFLASLEEPARIVLIDGDEFEPRNAERMLFSRCGNKAAVVRDELLELVETGSLTIAAVEEYATVENLGRLVNEGDVVLLCLDNHATRKLVGDHCRSRRDVCLVSGGNDDVGEDGSGRFQRGTFGNVQNHLRRDGVDRTPPLDAFPPEIASPRDALPGDVSCTEALLTVPQILFTNLATASAMLNAFSLHVSEALSYPELCFDVAEGLMRPIALPGVRLLKEAGSGEPSAAARVRRRPMSPAAGEPG